MKVYNYDREMMKIISENEKKGVKPTILLHACCAPCSTSVIERLKDNFIITVFFYNPNMDSNEEYIHRLEEQKRLCEYHGINLIEKGYDPSEFYSAVKGKEDEREGGLRCFECYKLRLNKTAETAKEMGFDYFTTTLSVSPLKNAEMLNQKGFLAEQEFGVKFLPSDFKKRNGYVRSVELSNQFNMYRQNYCGCKFSKNKTP